MKINIFTFQRGLEEIEDAIAIRIKSKDYNLLILKDYLAIVGEIDGEIEIETANDKKVLKNIKAYYMNHENKFDLLLEGE